MPELPEVQTVVNQLKEGLIGKTIIGLDIRLPKLFFGDQRKVINAKIVDVKRRAKMILIKLNNDSNIVVHLKMTGQLIYSDSQNVAAFPNPIPFAGTSLPGKTTHIILKLDKGALFFNDMRQFGWMKVLTDDEVIEVHEKHGPEPFGDDFTVEYLTKILASWGRPVKLLLLEQSKIAGIGNIYANEALWYAGISPMKRGREVTKIKELYESIKKVLEMGLEYGGSSAADEAFVNAFGLPGKMQNHFMVYQKNGTPCPRCGKTITKSTIGGRGTFYCPECQK
ncbi:bifunctional DNA-formamidopyrimidine glycosylase/DNA-(apurinic or apyrimidinic site) lyase [Candidatus Microgenomates bacterium]|nr:bifunctional DNA-formamidopyrimidine glycosylase/DNA-(apurinic or apyrimidinic site) lyase [Candidatus Microgenomates bacterium]